jgi:signal transduction histidine kinase
MDRIQRLFKGQERLVADVSHDLRTPLTTIQGNMELLQRMATAAPSPGAQSLDVFAEIVAEVENETERMSEMINDLLLLAQADSGMLKLQMEQVEMDTLLLEVYRQTRRMAEHKKGQGALDVRLGTEDQALVLGDPERLRQLLLNLTDNAIKYTPSGGSITLSLENSEGWVHVAVQDTGIGIGPEQQSQIFERFYRTDKARGRGPGGSGLGLSIVQWIAHAHNGHVTVESKPGQGSTFALHLPEYAPAALAAGSADAAETPTPPNRAAHEAVAT